MPAAYMQYANLKKSYCVYTYDCFNIYLSL